MSETEAPDTEYRLVDKEDLQFDDDARDVRENVVEKLEDRIGESGYNPAKPLRTVRKNGHYIVGDGNHRLETLHQLEWDEKVPIIVEPDGDIHQIAIESNRDEDTYAPLDLFDYLDRIEALREQELTQKQIAEVLSDGDEEWSESRVKNHSMLLSNIVTEVLDIAKGQQEGRVTEEVTSVTFTEGWFRTIEIYDLEDEWQTEDEDEPVHAQVRFIDWFVNEKNCKPKKSKVKRKISELKEVQDQLGIVEAELNEGVDDEERDELRYAVMRNEYTEDSLRDAIESANQGAKNQTYFGVDSVEKLKEFEDNKFACVVTDPPYGVEYENHRESDRPSFGEDAPDALDLLYDVFEELNRVCKANAHLYVFFPTKLYAEVKEVATEFFAIDEVPIVWVKNNHAPTRDAQDGFKKMYAQKYETLFHLRAENGDSRELKGDSSPNVLEYDVPKGDDRWHDSQKPIGLWEELLRNSTGVGETIIDPFAGSGSALLAAERTGRHYVGIEKSEEYESRFKRELREMADDEDGDSS